MQPSPLTPLTGRPTARFDTIAVLPISVISTVKPNTLPTPYTDKVRSTSLQCHLCLLRLEPGVQQLYGDVDILRRTRDRHESFVRVGRLARAGRRAGVRHSDLTSGLLSNLVDLGSAFTDDWGQGGRGVGRGSLTGTDEGVWDVDLLCLGVRTRSWARTSTSAHPAWR